MLQTSSEGVRHLKPQTHDGSIYRCNVCEKEFARPKEMDDDAWFAEVERLYESHKHK
jgi:hypothetical protein